MLEPNPMEIGKKIKELRLKKGLSQKELAEIIGSAPSAIGNYESGVRIPKDRIKIALAKALGKSVEFIFFPE